MTNPPYDPDGFYEALGVLPEATLDEIKRAFRLRAMQLHPDHNPDDPWAEERFKKLREAFNVLSHPEARQLYDTEPFVDPSEVDFGLIGPELPVCEKTVRICGYAGKRPGPARFSKSEGAWWILFEDRRSSSRQVFRELIFRSAWAPDLPIGKVTDNIRIHVNDEPLRLDLVAVVAGTPVATDAMGSGSHAYSGVPPAGTASADPGAAAPSSATVVTGPAPGSGYGGAIVAIAKSLLLRSSTKAPVTFFEAIAWSVVALVVTSFLIAPPAAFLLYAVIGGVAGYSDHVFIPLYLVVIAVLDLLAFIEVWRRYVISGRALPRPAYPGARIAEAVLPKAEEFGRRVWLALVCVVLASFVLGLLPLPQPVVGALIVLLLIPGRYWLGTSSLALLVLGGYGLWGVLTIAGLSVWFLFALSLVTVCVLRARWQ